jgi:hypothetical protein
MNTRDMLLLFMIQAALYGKKYIGTNQYSTWIFLCGIGFIPDFVTYPQKGRNG